MSNSTTFRTLILAGALGTLFSPLAHADTAYRPADSTTASGLTRAEVIADTNLWVRAGVDRFSEQALHYNISTPQYEQALAEYHRLRNGPAYAEEVAKVEAQRGEASTRLSHR